MKDYYTLMQYWEKTNEWHIAFGDYDKKVVEAERDDIRYFNDAPLKHFKIDKSEVAR